MNQWNLVIVGCCLITAVSLTNAQSTASDLAAEHMTKVERFLEGQIPVGVYIYMYAWKQNSDPAAHDLDDAIAEMAKDGLNYLYVGGVSDTPAWSRLLELCEKYRIAVVPQLDFSYLSKRNMSEVDALVARAVPFIKKYKDHPAVMAFSVCEEPYLSMMPIVKQYYEGIRREVPDASLHLLHNNLKAALATQPPYPQIMGSDRYGFWWEMSGHRATPAYALEWFHTQLSLYHQFAAQRGVDFQSVFTTAVSAYVISPEKLKKSFYGLGADTPDGREKFYRMVKGLADKENQGWTKAQDEDLRYWYYYRPPVNSVRAMSWLSIMEGARSTAIWAWIPPGVLSKTKTYEELAYTKPGKSYWNYLSGKKGLGSAQYAEYVEFAGEVQRYAGLIRVMTKEGVPFPSQFPLGHELVPDTNGAKVILNIEGDDVAWQAFSVPGYSGKVVVMVNTAVGSWCDGRSPKYLSPRDTFRIDDKGELVDYVPFTKPRELLCEILLDNMACFDLQTGKAVKLNRDQTMTLPVTPGGGRLIFLAPKGSDQWGKFKNEFEL